MDKLAISIKVKDIAVTFNRLLREWESLTGCVANFSWKFDRDGRKEIHVSEINMPIMAPDLEESSARAEEILSNAKDMRITTRSTDELER